MGSGRTITPTQNGSGNLVSGETQRQFLASSHCLVVVTRASEQFKDTKITISPIWILQMTNNQASTEKDKEITWRKRNLEKESESLFQAK